MTYISARLGRWLILPVEPAHPHLAQLLQPLPTLPPPRHHPTKLCLHPLHLYAVRNQVRARVAIPLFRIAQRHARLEVVQRRHVPLGLDDLARRGRRVGLHGRVALVREDRGDGACLKVESHVDGGVVEAVEGVDAPEGEEGGGEDEEEGEVGEELGLRGLYVSSGRTSRSRPWPECPQVVTVMRVGSLSGDPAR